MEEARWNNSGGGARRRGGFPFHVEIAGISIPENARLPDLTSFSIYARSRGGSNGQRMCRPFNIGVEAVVFAPSAR